MIPTKEEINRLAAEACGYTMYHYNKGYGDYWMLLLPESFTPANFLYPENERATEAEAWADAPKFCTDRNALPELYRRLEQDSAWKFVEELNRLICEGNGGRAMRWSMITASPLLQTIAALKALGRWPDGWETPEDTE